MATAAFAGYYKNKNASNKRWLRDVFEKGDLYVFYVASESLKCDA
jgi:hypothetical protein